MPTPDTEAELVIDIEIRLLAVADADLDADELKLLLAAEVKLEESVAADVALAVCVSDAEYEAIEDRLNDAGELLVDVAVAEADED